MCLIFVFEQVYNRHSKNQIIIIQSHVLQNNYMKFRIEK